MALIKSSPGQKWPGFSFALHPTRCRAFILPRCNAASYKRLQRVLCCQCNYTAHATKQSTGLYSGFSDDCTRSTARDTRQTQATIIPHTPRWSVSQRRSASSEYRYQHHAGRYTGQHSRPIIIRYIRAQRCAPVIDPCQTVQRIADHANPTGQSDSRCAAGGAEPLTALAVSLFGLSPDSQ